jgi:hypothetical protein
VQSVYVLFPVLDSDVWSWFKIIQELEEKSGERSYIYTHFAIKNLRTWTTWFDAVIKKIKSKNYIGN